VPGPSLSSEQILVVSYSEWLRRRIQKPLEPAGYSVDHARGAGELARHRRQRPFLLCFLDVRGHERAEDVAECFRARPAERYVLVLGPWQEAGGKSARGGVDVFGFLREPFTGAEVLAWSKRASDEAHLKKGDRPLEDELYARFRDFLQNLGPQPMTALHPLVLERVEEPLIRSVLEWTGGNQTRAAEVLGIHRNTLRAKIRSLGINPSTICADRP
jgi:Fis family transcriptional regulator